MSETARKTSTVGPNDGPDTMVLTSPHITVNSSPGSSADLRYTAANGNVVQIPGSPFGNGDHDVQTGTLFHYTLGIGTSMVTYQ